MDVRLKLRARPIIPPGVLTAARAAIGDSKAKAARRIYASRSAWHLWESGKRPIPRGPWEHYLIKARREWRKQHPQNKPPWQPTDASKLVGLRLKARMLHGQVLEVSRA